ncbi:hypothetical protein BCR36DRAFT_373433 [Piromyces finnis]|uniref:Uncharacterized protein n=1 Tax=Piromyces finnis TaxID=1754191 RepID=A0A1Y1UZH2_9FUNG|nr:hypothetical protein BCR36DRAFT_373433 [Piromyces finnis]|eukprot:ORX44133.1 hypothetical protein BCR36DRAFT_373433 [Piromyces finnis]
MSKLPKIDQAEKPEIPIIARFKGPGPAAYTLKTTIGNNTYNGKTAPSYSFGMKLKPQKKLVTPGPNEFTPKALRNGVTSSPAYSMTGRNFFPNKIATESPGPASYSYSNYYQSKCKSSPAYSLLGRHNSAKLSITPSPAAYSTDKKVGSDTPAWTMRPSLPKKQIQTSPGPAEYDPVNYNLVKKSSPAYSLHLRLASDDNFTLPNGKLKNGNVVASGKKPRSKFVVPGPGAYDINLTSIKNSSPRFSFGTKHSEFKAAYIEKESDFMEKE